MNQSGLVSVIIPVYNVEQYLKECIESVLSQTYQDWETILVDDGSTDASGEICDSYAKQDNRIRVIHQKNGGLSIARNVGFCQATGEYIYFLDSDDWIIPQAFQLLVDQIEKERAELVFFDAVSFLDGDEQRNIQQRYIRNHTYRTEEGYTVLEKLQENKEYHSAVPLLFFKKEFLKKIGITFVDKILYEDMIFTYEVFCKAKCVAQLNKALYQRRYRVDSIMTSKRTIRNFESAYTVYNKVRDISVQEGLLCHKTAQDYIVRCAFHGLNIYRNLNKKEQKTCRKEYLELKNDILYNNAYKSKALRARCYGIVPWFCYKVYEKGLHIVRSL